MGYPFGRYPRDIYSGGNQSTNANERIKHNNVVNCSIFIENCIVCDSKLRKGKYGILLNGTIEEDFLHLIYQTCSLWVGQHKMYFQVMDSVFHP